MWTEAAAIAVAEPQRPALIEATRRVTYGALWRDVQRFAAALASAGLTDGERVAIVLPNCIESVVALYGTWLAGGVAVPLDVRAGARELGRWLMECEARFVVHAPRHAELERATRGLDRRPQRFAWTYEGETQSEAEPAHRPPREATRDRTPGRLAALVYTAGTTRRPKGVMLSRGNLVANAKASVAYLGLTGAESVVATLPFHRACGASVLHAYLSVGARLVLVPSAFAAHGVVEAIARERASGLSALPATFALLLDVVDLATYDVSSLRYVTQTGGAMAPALIRRVRTALPNARFFVTYGQTEATAELTSMPPERLDEKQGSVGLAVPGVSLEIRREDGARAATGEVGEVWASGDNVMIGLLNDPAATRAVIRDGWLDTGDLAHVDGDGFVFLAGRRSDLPGSLAGRGGAS